VLDDVVSRGYCVIRAKAKGVVDKVHAQGPHRDVCGQGVVQALNVDKKN